MNLRSVFRMLITIGILVTVTNAQIKVDSIPNLSGSALYQIKIATPICDFDSDGSKDIWVVGAYESTSAGSTTNLVKWYGIYSLSRKNYLYSKVFPEVFNYQDLSCLRADTVSSNLLILFDGTILSYGSEPTVLKKN